MIIKTDEYELEISQGTDVYIGSKERGQAFKKWSEIDDNVKVGLERIAKQAESLVKYSEELLFTKTNTWDKL
jgi:hypothetical protein